MWTELTNLGPYVIIFWAAHFVSTTQCVKGEKKEGYLFNAQLAGSWQQISLLLHKVGKVRSWSPATTGFMWIEKDFRVQYSLAAAAALPCKIDAMILLPILLKNSSLDPDIWLFCRTHLKRGEVWSRSTTVEWRRRRKDALWGQVFTVLEQSMHFTWESLWSWWQSLMSIIYDNCSRRLL